MQLLLQLLVKAAATLAAPMLLFCHSLALRSLPLLPFSTDLKSLTNLFF
jgi:hypothetical protein